MAQGMPRLAGITSCRMILRKVATISRNGAFAKKFKPILARRDAQSARRCPKDGMGCEAEGPPKFYVLPHAPQTGTIITPWASMSCRRMMSRRTTPTIDQLTMRTG
jgi:hypothetical protein